MDSSQFRLYSGHIKSLQDIPVEQSNQIKIFVSCNPSGKDFKVEREAIFSRVIPVLREETKAKYGLELHYMDLMYGLEADDGSYKCREFRLKELIRAHKLSAGPSFLALIGQKYGHRPIPQLILSDIFELILTALHKSPGRRSRNLSLMQKWYIQDENSIPSVHVLQPWQVHGEEVWRAEKESLQSVLMFGVELCCKDGSLPPEALRAYFASELENEVKHGLMNGQTGNAVVVERTISDLPNYTCEEEAKTFTEVEWNDVNETWQQEVASQQLLESLKTSAIAENLDKSNIFKYSVLWRFDSGIHPDFHKQYVDTLCEDVTAKLREQISDAAAVTMARREHRSRLHNEVLTHWRKAVERGADCQGRDRELDALNNYLKAPDNHEFFTMYGVSGSGKTCLMSKLLLEMDSLHSLSTITVARFIGLTQESAELKDLLHSICEQILICLDRTHVAVPMDFAEILKFFSTLLHEIPSSIQLILLLDSLNSLLPDFNAHLLQWLPKTLPKNVKIIISCQPHAHGMFTRIKTELIKENHGNFLEVNALGDDQAMLLTLHWLQQENMCLTNVQATVLRSAFQRCSLPLYVRFVFDRVKEWRSFDTIREETLGTDCDSYLTIFFDELEASHGKILVQQSMSYLTASKTGLSDMEMEDLLSLDESVLEEIYKNKTPGVRRCPPGTWAKLRNDLDVLLKLKIEDEFDVYCWMHSIVKNFIEKRYLSSTTHLKSVHHTIADYYLGTWHKNPMKYTSATGKVLVQDRNVLSQPLTYTNVLGETQYNKRKYDQVPRQLYLAGRLKELNAKVMFNYHWLYNKIKALSLQKILADFNLNPSVEATLLEGALRSSQSILLDDINNMPVELSGRLLPYYHTHAHIKALIDQCDTSGLEHCALVPLFNYHQVPGSPLQYTFNSEENVDSLLVTHDQRYALAKSNHSQQIRKFDLLTGETQNKIVTSHGQAYLSPDDVHLVVVDNETEKSVKVHQASDGAFMFQLIPSNFLGAKEQRKYHLGPVVIARHYIAMLVTTDTTFLCIASFAKQQFERVIDLEGKSNVVAIAANQKYLVCNIGFKLATFSLKMFDQISSVEVEYKPAHIIINRASTKAYVADSQSHIVTIAHLTSDGQSQMIYKISLQKLLDNDQILALTLSHDEKMLLIRAEAKIVIYNCTTDKVQLEVKRPNTVMKEFRLPKHSKPTKIIYTDAIFSHDDALLMTSLFRNIQFWNLKSGTPMATNILAPVGIITKVHQSAFQGQIVTTQQDSSIIQVWNLADYIMDITSLDRLTVRIEKLVLTEDKKTCFAMGVASDEVGVIDMSTGLLSNLLTHEGNVSELTAVCDGSYVLVTLEPSNTEYCNKLWNVSERRIVKEFGREPGYTTSLKKANIIIHLSQISAEYQAPYGIKIFDLRSGALQETTYDFVINYAISKPFVTDEDTYMVLLTADKYIEREAKYSNPSICAFYLKGRYMHSIIGRKELGSFLDDRHIVSLVPIPYKGTEIIALYKPAANMLHGAFGFATIDLAMGSLLQYSDNFLAPKTNLGSFYLNNDGLQCVNSDLGMMFAMKTGQRTATINNQGSPLALLMDGKVIAYYQGSLLTVERVVDNKVIAQCDVHADICYITSSNDNRTILLGCVDGTVLGYMMIDPETDEVEKTVARIASRQPIVDQIGNSKEKRPNTASTWDKADAEVKKLPIAHYESPSRDHEVLKTIRPVYRSMTARNIVKSGVSTRAATAGFDRSRACCLM